MTIPYQKTGSQDAILSPLRVEHAQRVGEGLAANGYKEEFIEALLATAKEEGVEIAAESALACLVRAFTLHAATPEADLRRELGEELFQTFEQAGLWQRVEGGLTGRAVLFARQQGFVLHDHVREGATAAGMYLVMDVSASTLQVSRSVPARPYGRVLDLCCGGGIQAFLLAPHAKEIVAVDRNPRALNYGRFGAALNGYSHIDFRESDLYSAVKGERFDVMVCNPPYVLSPERERYYRDGGMEGDSLAETIVRGAGAHLEEGGYAHLVCDVATQGGETAAARLCRWAAGSGCDLLAILAPPMEATAYAQAWSEPGGGQSAREQEARWMEQFAALQITGVTHMLVAMRRRTGKNWVVFDQLPREIEGHFGTQIARRFQGQDFLRMDELWERRLRLAPETRVQRTIRAEGGRWVTEGAKAYLSEGLLYEFVVDPRTVDFLLFFDGEATLEAVLQRVAGAMGMPAERVRGGWLAYVKQLAGDGVLEVAG